MIRLSPIWGKGAWIRTDREGKYRQYALTCGPRGPDQRRPTAIEVRLVSQLEASNYVTPERLNPSHPNRAIPVLRRAKMVLYSALRQIWVPDVGTYDWLIATKQRMRNFPANHQEDDHVDANHFRAPRARSRKKLPVSAPGDRQPLRLESARASSGELSEGYSSYG